MKPPGFFTNDHKHYPVLSAFLALAVATGLAAFAGHSQIMLKGDAFFYTKMLRYLIYGEFHRVYTVWPAGFPALGLPFTALGVYPGVSLFLVDLVCFAALIFLCDAYLLRHRFGPWERIALLLALVALPVIWGSLFIPNSELPFAISVFAIGYGLYRLPKTRGYIILSLAIAAGFLLRYIGIVFLAVFPIVFLMNRKSRNSPENRKLFTAALFPVLVVVGYTSMNYLWTSDITGAARKPAGFALIDSLSGFGTALSLALSPFIRGVFHDLVTAAIGIVLTALLILLIIACWRSSRCPAFVRMLSIPTVLYSIGMILARSSVIYALDTPTRAIPVLPFVLLAGAAFLRQRKMLLFACTALMIVAGTAQCIKRASWMDNNLPVRQAEAFLSAHAKAGDRILVNHAGRDIFRATFNDVTFIDSGGLENPPRGYDYVFLLPYAYGKRKTYTFDARIRACVRLGRLEQAGYTQIGKADTYIVYAKKRGPRGM